MARCALRRAPAGTGAILSATMQTEMRVVYNRADCPYGCGEPLPERLRWQGTPCPRCGRPLHPLGPIDDQEGGILWPPAHIPRPPEAGQPDVTIWYVVREDEAPDRMAISWAELQRRGDMSDERYRTTVIAVIVSVLLVSVLLVATALTYFPMLSATYGLMVAAAVSCGALALLPSIVSAMGLTEVGYELPGPWQSISIMTTLAVPVVAAVGAAVLVGPSSDLANFMRAVGGVVAGLVAFFGTSIAGAPREPQVFTVTVDGREWTGDEALQHQQDAYKEAISAGWKRPRGWRPSPAFIARYVLLVCTVPPVAGVGVALLIAEWN